MLWLSGLRVRKQTGLSAESKLGRRHYKILSTSQRPSVPGRVINTPSRPHCTTVYAALFLSVMTPLSKLWRIDLRFADGSTVEEATQSVGNMEVDDDPPTEEETTDEEELGDETG